MYKSVFKDCVNVIGNCLRTAELAGLGNFIKSAAEVKLAVILIRICTETESGYAVCTVQAFHTHKEYCYAVI